MCNPSREYEDSRCGVESVLFRQAEIRGGSDSTPCTPAAIGPSIAPEKLQRAQLLQMLCSIRTEPTGIRFSWL